jgi:hypothetical protein
LHGQARSVDCHLSALYIFSSQTQVLCIVGPDGYFKRVTCDIPYTYTVPTVYHI